MSRRLLVLMCSIFLIVPLCFMGCGSGSDGATGATGAAGAPRADRSDSHRRSGVVCRLP